MGEPEVFSSDLGFIEGPAWSDRGTLYVASISRGCVYELDAKGTIISKTTTGGGPNGLALGHDAIYVAQNGGIFGASGRATPCIQKIQDGAVTELFTDVFAAPNDLCFGPDGRLYVSDPVTDKAVLEPIEGRVLACDLATGSCEVIAAGRLFPNGLAFDASGKHLYLTQTYSRLVERFSFSGDKLVSDGTFCHLANGRPDGMAIDRAGNLWICTPGTGGIEVFDSAGKALLRTELGEGTMATNCCFGGSNDTDVFITLAGKGSVARLRAPAPGLPLRKESAL